MTQAIFTHKSYATARNFCVFSNKIAAGAIRNISGSNAKPIIPLFGSICNYFSRQLFSALKPLSIIFYFIIIFLQQGINVMKFVTARLR